jgi:hypothetical protein
VAGGAFQQWSGIDVGDLPARLFFGLTVGVAALLAGAVWWVALALIPAIWVGTTVGNFGGIGMGRSGNPYWRDFGGLTLHGLLGVAAPALLVWWVGHFWPALLLAGLSIAPLYTAGWAPRWQARRAVVTSRAAWRQ